MRSGRKPSYKGTRLLFAGTIIPMTCPVHAQLKDDTERPDGRQEAKEGRDTRAEKQVQQSYSYVQLVGQGRHKRPKGVQRRRAKNNNKTKQKGF